MRRETYTICNLSPPRTYLPRAFPAVTVLLAVDDAPVPVSDQAKYRIATEAEMLQHRRAIPVDKDIGILDELEEFLSPSMTLKIYVNARLTNTPIDKGDWELGIGGTRHANHCCTQGCADPPDSGRGNGSCKFQYFNPRQWSAI